jgi:hypothetical protein
MNRAVLVAAAASSGILFLSAAAYLTYPSYRSATMDPRPILAWVAKQNLPVGSSQLLVAPVELAVPSHEHAVYAKHLADGRTCILVKTSIGYKDNFEGVLACDGPLAPQEIVADAGPRRVCLDLLDPTFRDLIIRGPRGPNALNVYFDWN